MQRPPRLQKTALAITRWIGSPASIFLHTILFAATISLLIARVFPFDVVILIFNTAVSLEAIYLALFIQMTVNYTTSAVEAVGEDIEDIQEDVDEIQKDVDELQEDVEEITEEDAAEDRRESEQKDALEQIQTDLRKLMDDIERLKK